MKVLRTIQKICGKLSTGLAWVAAVFLFCLMCFVSYEVIARYFFQSPTNWSLELNQFLYCGIIAFGGAYALFLEGHVSVDIFASKLKPRGKAILDIFGTLIIMVILVVVIWKTYESVTDAIAWHETTGSIWNPVTWPAKLSMPIGAVFFFVQAIGRFAKNIEILITGVSTDPKEEIPTIEDIDELMSGEEEKE